MKLSAVLSLLSLAGALAAAPPAPLIAKPGLVTPEWLAARLSNPTLRVIDARAGLGPYLQGHVPGAIYLNTETLRISRGGQPAQMLEPRELAHIFGQIGLGNDHSVVVYSGVDEAFSHATYVAFVLEYLGHRRVAVLDGGFERWKQEGRPVTTAPPRLKPGKFAARPVPALVADAAQVRQAAESRQALLLDARKPQQFAAGHIPDATNCYSADLIQTNAAPSFKDAGALRRLLPGAAGGTPPVIAYCNSGREASLSWFTLRHVLGVTNAALYPGSWIDWTARDLPKATGP